MLIYTDKLTTVSLFTIMYNVNVHIIDLIYDGLMLQYAITMRYSYVLIGLDCVDKSTHHVG